MATFKVFYYAGPDGTTPQRGDAERIRLLLTEVGYKYEDIALDNATFEAMCKDKTILMGALPVLQIKEAGASSWDTYENTSAIMATIAARADAEKKGQGSNKFSGTEGTGATKSMAIDQLVSEFEAVLNSRAGKVADAAVVSKYLRLFDGVLHTNDGGDVRTDVYTYGSMFTYADISVFSITNAVASIYGVDAVQEYHKLWEFHNNVLKRARIAMRVSKRPDIN